ncbi:MAG: phosphodiesterase [Ruminococcaceae bacterium]|nr:phosphodiesterase [Oscillospiraceae bacterium]
MKYLVASDIHGSAYYCRELCAAIERENPDRIFFLGDVLYHGPRNDLPKDYAPKEVIAMLAPFADRILSVRGNCDTEVDQMVLPFPVMADTAYIQCGDKLVLATHGHIWNTDKLPPMGGVSVLLYGHTHIPACVEHDGYVYMNPGSVSIPKEGSSHSYMILEDGVFSWRELSGEEYKKYEL